jgi:aerobic carbon-monoxide dehydrogenase large subunit
MLGTAEAELEWSEGGARMRNARTRPVSLAAIARRAAENPLSPGLTSLEEKENHQVPGIAFANGVHMAEVEINPETGVLRVTHYAAVHDCGTVINPMIVEGQVHGGVAQGLGGTLFEEVRYDDAGYPLTTGFLNYLLPTAGDMPHILSGSMSSPSPLNPFGMKGAGEGGTVGGVGSIASAIADALAPLGISLSSDGPFTPPTLLRLIRSASVAHRFDWGNSSHV